MGLEIIMLHTLRYGVTKSCVYLEGEKVFCFYIEMGYVGGYKCANIKMRSFKG